MENMKNTPEEAAGRHPNCLKIWLDLAPRGYRQKLVSITGISDSYLTFLANGYRDNPSLKHAKAMVDTINELNKEIKLYYNVVLPDLSLDCISKIEKTHTYVPKNKRVK